MRDPSGHTCLPSFVVVAHLLREIIAHSGSYYGVIGPIRAYERTFIDTFTGSDGTETPY
ncbi:hypothetical protein DPMN_104196 [Dreissena polymorpha]|uniref:Uncharacterized protein n=1 Tax=Dreissena polymorpha TaxID=45954 RepID=A0A9D4HCM0_DREPO|nr:hypothetical protein DPMN_104196 [Dreissena polymorpha]